MDDITTRRDFMKSDFAMPKMGLSDQFKGIAPPPYEKPCPPDAPRIPLPSPDGVSLVQPDVRACIRDRRSHRMFAESALRLDELSYLLWATQGVKQADPSGFFTLRTTPSAGARHPFETYLIVRQVENLSPGIYRYLPISHEIIGEHAPVDLADRLNLAVLGQSFCSQAAVMFAWSCLPYRGEWRYVTHAHKVMLIDAGHMAQNLYLACESIGCGTCAIGAYNQKAIDDLIGLDGNDEFIVYLAPVGHLSKDAR